MHLFLIFLNRGARRRANAEAPWPGLKVLYRPGASKPFFFPTLPSESIQPLGRSPSARAEKLPKIDPRGFCLGMGRVPGSFQSRRALLIQRRSERGSIFRQLFGTGRRRTPRARSSRKAASGRSRVRRIFRVPSDHHGASAFAAGVLRDVRKNALDAARTSSPRTSSRTLCKTKRRVNTAWANTT